MSVDTTFEREWSRYLRLLPEVVAKKPDEALLLEKEDTTELIGDIVDELAETDELVEAWHAEDQRSGEFLLREMKLFNDAVESDLDSFDQSVNDEAAWVAARVDQADTVKGSIESAVGRISKWLQKLLT